MMRGVSKVIVNWITDDKMCVYVSHGKVRVWFGVKVKCLEVSRVVWYRPQHKQYHR